MALFELGFRNELPSVVVKEFDRLLAAVSEFLLREHNEDGSHRVVATPQTIPVGGMIQWPSDTIPNKWLLCDGSQVNRIKYADLFTVIGTTYGVGNGTTTFHLPDLRQRFALGKGVSGTGDGLGETGGAIDHTHTFGSGGVSGTTSANGGHSHSASSNASAESASVAAGADFEVSTASHTHGISVSETGDHQHTFSASVTGVTLGTNNPPFLVVNYIILTGVEE